MDATTIRQHSFWTTTGRANNDLWIMESYCMAPSCRLKNLETGEVQNFGMGGITAKEFEPVKMDKSLELKLLRLFNR